MTISPDEKSYNILMIAPTMFFADYGGHIRILEEAKILRRFGHRVTILTYPNGRDIADLDIRRSLGVPFNYRVEVGSSRHRYYLDMMLGLKSLRYIFKNKPDVIHAHMHEGALIGWLVSKLTGAPMIFDFQGSLTGEMLDHHFISGSSRLFRLFRGLERRIDHMGKVILTSSRHAAGLLKNEFGVSGGRIHPTPDCVDTDTFRPNILSHAEKVTLKNAWGIPQDKQLIVYAGLLAQYQGTDLLLRALQVLKRQRNDFHLLLMGFPNLPYYRSLASELGLADLVTFTGKIPYESLPAYLALGDIATAPKLSATEGCGKILNYMSMGLPTITFDTPVSREFLGTHGICASERTFESLSRALSQALDMPKAEQRQLGRWLRQRAMANYSWEKIGRQVEFLYEAVLAGHPQPATVLEQALTTH